jgi:hypothetical protein
MPSVELMIIVATLAKAAQLALDTQQQNRDPTPEEMQPIRDAFHASIDGLIEASKPADTTPGGG